MTKVLLFGATGQVGTDCRTEAHWRQIELITPSRKEADFATPETVYNVVMRCKPSLVLNAAAYTSVDGAEDNARLATLINTTSVAVLAKACQTLQIPLLQLSTDYVFSGKSSQAYKETAATAPLNVYGFTKEQGEKVALDNCSRCIILRTSWIFGSNGKNFVKTMLELGKQKKPIKVVSDQFGNPTYSVHIAEAIFDLIDLYIKVQELPWGIYHLADKDPTSRYEFVRAIFQVQAAKYHLESPDIIPVATSSFPTRAVRPKYSVLNCNKLSQLLGRSMKRWRNGLDDMLSVCRDGTRN